jgi:hypothetical protein
MIAGGARTERRLLADDSSPATSPDAWKKLLSDDAVKAVLETQVDVIDKSMKSAGTFRRALKKMEITGRIIAALGNVEVYRQTGEAAQKGAALREAGLALTKAAADKKFEDAEKAVASIKGYPASTAPAAEANPAEWMKLLDIHGLMSGVSTADAETKRVVTSTKPADFKKDAESAAAYAYVLAMLGSAAREYETDGDWKKWCDEMARDSVAMAAALVKKDDAEAKAARDTLLKSCDACHEAYRVEE